MLRRKTNAIIDMLKQQIKSKFQKGATHGEANAPLKLYDHKKGTRHERNGAGH